MYEEVGEVLGVDWALFEIDPDLACCCDSVCSARCPCVVRSGGVAYTQGKRLVRRTDTVESLPIYECWEACGCSGSCTNRVVQLAGAPGLKVVPCGAKGLGVVTTEHILAGTYVTEYYGEYTDEDCDGEYVFELREQFGAREYVWRVDAERCGGVARFFNHSCEGNMAVVPVRVGHTVPRLSFFTTIDVPADTELTFRYRAVAVARRACLCGALHCQLFF